METDKMISTRRFVVVILIGLSAAVASAHTGRRITVKGDTF